MNRDRLLDYSSIRYFSIFLVIGMVIVVILSLFPQNISAATNPTVNTNAFFYDYQGNLVYMENQEDQKKERIYYYGDYEERYQENNPTPKETRLYTNLPGVTTLSTTTYQGTQQVKETVLLSKDYLSSVRGIIKEDGTSSPLSYFPYGDSRGSVPQINPTDKGFTGLPKITSSMLYQFGSRFYSSLLGVFTSPDTVEGFNRFRYAANNPIMFYDPSGHASQIPTDGGMSSGAYVASDAIRPQIGASAQTGMTNTSLINGPQNLCQFQDCISSASRSPWGEIGFTLSNPTNFANFISAGINNLVFPYTYAIANSWEARLFGLDDSSLRHDPGYNQFAQLQDNSLSVPIPALTIESVAIPLTMRELNLKMKSTTYPSIQEAIGDIQKTLSGKLKEDITVNPVSLGEFLYGTKVSKYMSTQRGGYAKVRTALERLNPPDELLDIHAGYFFHAGEEPIGLLYGYHDIGATNMGTFWNFKGINSLGGHRSIDVSIAQPYSPVWQPQIPYMRNSLGVK